MSDELEWRPCPGFPAYEVSEKGDVRRIAPSKGGVVGKVICGSIKHGYREYDLFLGHGIRRGKSAHRLVCEAWHGPPPTPRHEAAHCDGTRLNNHYSNLRWATPAENQADKLAHGTHQWGERNPCCKLTESAVLEMRAAYTGRLGQINELSKRYGVAARTVGQIIRGERWRMAGDYRQHHNAAKLGKRRAHGC